MSRINADVKETAIETIRVKGTMKAGAEAAGVTVRTLNEEMRRSAIFKRRVLEAREEGKRNVADSGIELIQDYAFGRCPFCHGSKNMLREVCPYCNGTGLSSKDNKTDRNRLTAAIALANAFEPGFRGTTTVQGRIAHDVRVITAVPRPKYEIIEPEKKLLDKPPEKLLKSGKTRKVKIYDDKGEYMGIKVESVEEAIEGEVIKESE